MIGDTNISIKSNTPQVEHTLSQAWLWSNLIELPERFLWRWGGEQDRHKPSTQKLVFQRCAWRKRQEFAKCWCGNVFLRGSVLDSSAQNSHRTAFFFAIFFVLVYAYVQQCTEFTQHSTGETSTRYMVLSEPMRIPYMFVWWCSVRTYVQTTFRSSIPSYSGYCWYWEGESNITVTWSCLLVNIYWDWIQWTSSMQDPEHFSYLPFTIIFLVYSIHTYAYI